MDRTWLFTQLWQTLDAPVLQPIAAAASKDDGSQQAGPEEELEADVQVFPLPADLLCAIEIDDTVPACCWVCLRSCWLLSLWRCLSWAFLNQQSRQTCFAWQQPRRGCTMHRQPAGSSFLSAVIKLLSGLPLQSFTIVTASLMLECRHVTLVHLPSP